MALLLVGLGVVSPRFSKLGMPHTQNAFRAMPQPPTLPTAVWINPPAKEVTKVQ
ncbi:MAG TPA: hypothetical protein VF003_15045 [Pseudonocardiaceae bacterium]